MSTTKNSIAKIATARNIAGMVVSYANGIAAVRIASFGILRGVRVLGGSVSVGDEVSISYQGNDPYISVVGSSLSSSSSSRSSSAFPTIETNILERAGWTIGPTGILENNNLLIDPAGSIRTGNYLAGLAGWSINNDGSAEFANVNVRGTIQAAVFEQSLITATAGTLIIAKSAGVLSRDVTVLSSGTFTIYIKDISGSAWLFAASDIIRIKSVTASGVKDSWLSIGARGTVTGGEQSYTGCAYEYGDHTITHTEGTNCIDYGQAGQGILVMTADASAAPYYDVHTTEGEPWIDQVTVARLGNLSGITNNVLQPGGYGLFSENAYLLGLVAGREILLHNANKIIGKVAEYSDSVRVTFSGEPVSKTVTNPGFETGDFTGWTVVEGDGDWSIGTGKSGSYGAHYTFNGDLFSGPESILSNSVSSIAYGDYVEVAVYVSCNLTSAGTGSSTMRLYVWFYDSGGTPLGSTSIVIPAATYNWTRYSVTMEAPFSTSSVKVKIEHNWTTSTRQMHFIFDDVTVTTYPADTYIDLNENRILTESDMQMYGGLAVGAYATIPSNGYIDAENSIHAGINLRADGGVGSGSAVTSPAAGDFVGEGDLRVDGYAVVGGRTLAGVDDGDVLYTNTLTSRKNSVNHDVYAFKFDEDDAVYSATPATSIVTVTDSSVPTGAIGAKYAIRAVWNVAADNADIISVQDAGNVNTYGRVRNISPANVYVDAVIDVPLNTSKQFDMHFNNYAVRYPTNVIIDRIGVYI